jgi:Protein of unknown function (DUF559)/Transcriptional regulator, AbiEi antitoxin
MGGRTTPACRLSVGMRRPGDTAEGFRGVVEVAERRYGVVTFAQLMALGLSQSWVARQVAAGRLHRLHHLVFSVVPPRLLRVEGRWLAAVLACGEGAALSHTGAAALWDLRGVPSGRVHVTVPTHAGRPQRPGIRIHRSITLLPSLVTVRRGIRVTTVNRTVVDLRRMLSPAQLRAVLRQAQIRRLDTGPQPQSITDPDHTELERRFAALGRRHGFPPPLAQQVIGPYTVDFLWPAQRVIVEVDGWHTHGTQTAFEDDRARDAWLTAQGYRVVRFTWRQVTREGPWVAKVVLGLLASNPAPPSAGRLAGG